MLSAIAFQIRNSTNKINYTATNLNEKTCLKSTKERHCITWYSHFWDSNHASEYFCFEPVERCHANMTSHFGALYSTIRRTPFTHAQSKKICRNTHYIP